MKNCHLKRKIYTHFFNYSQQLKSHIMDIHMEIFFLSCFDSVQFFYCCKSSSDLGMSNISANRGGNRVIVQLVRNQSKWDECRAPRARNSGIFASNAGIICSAFATFGRDRIIWTRNASATFSRTRMMFFCSVMPGRSAARSTSAVYSPISVSLRPHPLKPFVKFNKSFMQSICEKKKSESQFFFQKVPVVFTIFFY